MGNDLYYRKSLAQPIRVPFEDRGGYFQGRHYQDIAIERSCSKRIAAGQQRILLTLATGTGKTFIAFQLAWKLFHSRWNLKDWKTDKVLN